MTTLEHYYDRVGEEPTYERVSQWATIISYNAFRMDGVSMCLPEMIAAEWMYHPYHFEMYQS